MATKKEIVWKSIEKLQDSDIDNYPHWFEIDGVEGKLLLPNWWGIHLDFENMRYTFDDCEYPDLNDLNKPYGRVKICYPYSAYDISFSEKDSQTFKNERLFVRDKIGSVIREFRENGFNVTREAILHNFYAWRFDMKSGYRDEENGYHLFSPCGCNPLSLIATSLHDIAKDWQTTYEC